MTTLIRGHHVLFAIVGFFAVTFTVNAVFVVHAINSFPGEYAAKSYLQGIAYNATLDRRAKQAERGWTAQIGLSGDAGNELVVRISDRNGAPVTGLAVVARVSVAGSAEAIEAQNLTEVADGEYRTLVTVEGARRDVLVEARRTGSQDVLFEAHKPINPGGDGA